MSLGNFFQALRAEKHVNFVALIQDNPAASARPSTMYKKPRVRKRRSNEWATPTKSNPNANRAAPKLPVRKKSDDTLAVLRPSVKTPCQTYDGDKNATFDASKTAHRALFEELDFESLSDEMKVLLKMLLSSSK